MAAARAFIASPPDETARRLGLEPGDLAVDPVVVWPDSAPAVALFAALQTQWHSDPDGRLRGLRYEALPAVWHALAIPRRRRPRLFGDLRVMESAVLAALREEGRTP